MLSHHGDSISQKGLATVDMAIRLIRDVQRLIRYFHHGKRVGLKFTLVSIKELETVLNLTTKIDRKLAELNKQCYQRP